MEEIAADAGVETATGADVSLDGSSDAFENLFEPLVAQDEPTDPLAPPAEGVEAAKAEPTPEELEERTLFDTLKSKFEPDSENFKAMKAKLAGVEGKYKALSSFEPLVAIPEVAESIQKLASGTLTDGKELAGAVEAVLGSPKAIEALKGQYFWSYADNPANADWVAKAMLGEHISGDFLKQIALATGPNGWIKPEALLEDIADLKTGEIPDAATLAAREALRADQAQFNKTQQERDEADKAKAAQDRQQAYVKDAEEILAFTDQPVEELRGKYGFAPNPKDPPEVAEIRASASLMYYSLQNTLMQKDPEVNNYLTNIKAVLDQGLKERAMTQFAPTLQNRTRIASIEAGKMVNKFLQPYIEKMRTQATKGEAAPQEIGSLAAQSGGGASTETTLQAGMRAYKEELARQNGNR